MLFSRQITKSLTAISFLISTAICSLTYANDFSQPTPIKITEENKKAFQLGATLLDNFHYSDISLNSISRDVLEDYLHNLDSAGIYFLQSDINDFLHSRAFALDQDIRDGDIKLAIEIFERYRERAIKLSDWSLERLKKPLDLKQKNTVHIPDYREKKLKSMRWFRTEEEIFAYQEARLVDSVIRLMLAGRTEEEAVKKLITRLQSQKKRLNQMDTSDVFSIYMNTLAHRFDPHSAYMSPENSEDFDIHMSLQLQGIGATLSADEDKISVAGLTPGGPAIKSGQLKIKDQIIAVGEGEDGEMQDVVGMRLDKAVRLIRGKKGTTVRLLVEPASGNPPEKEIKLIRDTINLEDQAAQGYIEEVEIEGNKEKIGVINLPSFYMDFDGANKGRKNYRSTSRDIKKILEDMNEKGVAGIIIDLRDDGGGSLMEVVKTVGLFIDRGPVVTVVNAKGKDDEHWDEVPGEVYSGPIAVLINESSASASEIFAAAIQDYRRGIIIGANSFGKGTVQTVIDLNRYTSKNSAKLGEINLTMAMFYRINGESTQLKGVVPDINLPTSYDLEDVGERSKNYALGWRKISPAVYLPYPNVEPSRLDEINKRHTQRMQSDPILQAYAQFNDRVRIENQKTDFSLNFDTRKKHYQEWKKYSTDYKKSQSAVVPPMKSDIKRKEDIDKSNALVELEDDKELFVPDVGLYEALKIFSDDISLQRQAGINPVEENIANKAEKK
ncbi:MAG: carboxy terminal-processing peptidase [Cardiobacteriaceae bacterium]|nr:carboxy terminal-processing peptidase [Cardiobacteriaceae bacterium]